MNFFNKINLNKVEHYYFSILNKNKSQFQLLLLKHRQIKYLKQQMVYTILFFLLMLLFYSLSFGLFLHYITFISNSHIYIYFYSILVCCYRLFHLVNNHVYNIYESSNFSTRSFLILDQNFLH